MSFGWTQGTRFWRADAPSSWSFEFGAPARQRNPSQVSVGRPNRRKLDLDNFATKAILDLFACHRVISDDPWVVTL